MRKLLLAVGLVGAVAASAALLPGRADAMTSGSTARIDAAVDSLNVVDTVQFVYGGRRHCWYADGWKGPGWYWCGYRTRVGFGWAGPAGWRGWAAPGAVVVAPAAPVVVVKPRPHVRERVVREKVIVRP